MFAKESSLVRPPRDKIFIYSVAELWFSLFRNSQQHILCLVSKISSHIVGIISWIFIQLNWIYISKFFFCISKQFFPWPCEVIGNFEGEIDVKTFSYKALNFYYNLWVRDIFGRNEEAATRHLAILSGLWNLAVRTNWYPSPSKSTIKAARHRTEWIRVSLVCADRENFWEFGIFFTVHSSRQSANFL